MSNIKDTRKEEENEEVKKKGRINSLLEYIDNSLSVLSNASDVLSLDDVKTVRKGKTSLESLKKELE